MVGTKMKITILEVKRQYARPMPLQAFFDFCLANSLVENFEKTLKRSEETLGRVRTRKTENDRFFGNLSKKNTCHYKIFS